MKKQKKDGKKIQEKQIQKIQEELENKQKLPENIQEKMNRKIQINVLVAITVMLYFYFLNLGSTSVEELTFLSNLKGFSMIILLGTIILFETSYLSNTCFLS